MSTVRLVAVRAGALEEGVVKVMDPVSHALSGTVSPRSAPFKRRMLGLHNNSPYTPLMDSLDYGIIDRLRLNARAGYGDIGEVIGLSASAVKRRVDRLVADGVIRNFTIQVDPAVDGLSTEAYVELFCRGTVAPDELKRMLSGIPEVVDAGTVTGSADAIVHMRSRDIPS